MSEQVEHLNLKIRARRLAVSGGSSLTKEATRLWHFLGREFASEQSLTIVTGGLQKRKDSPGTLAADWAFVHGVIQELSNLEVMPATHLETMLPSKEKDWPENLIRFEEGHVIRLQNRNSQSRRFSMVNSCDLVLAIEGDVGTKTVLDLALAIEKPILPLPFGKGTSAEMWKQYRTDIQGWFDISDQEADELEKVDLEKLNDNESRILAVSLKRHVLKGFLRKCFVMMPFADEKAPVYDQVIQPTLSSMDIIAIRVDRLGLTGDAVDTIRKAIGSCYGAIADITGYKPNVMYELGLAHAENKPTIIVCRVDKDTEELDLPFDLANQHIIVYSDDFEKLAVRLRESLGVVFGE